MPFSIHEARGTGQPLARHWVDLDGDGRRDLVVVTGRSTVPRPQEEDRVSALVSWLHVTPSFLDRREVALFRQTDGGLQPWGAPLALPGDCSAFDVADLDGDGRPEIVFSAGYRVYAFARPAGSEAWPADPKTLCDAEMLLGTSRAFAPEAHLVLEAPGRPTTLLLSTTAGLEIRRTQADGTIPEHANLVLREGLRIVGLNARGASVWDPAPRLVDGEGDGTPDLLFRLPDALALYRGDASGLFDTKPLLWPTKVPSAVIEDVNGDGLLDIASFPRSGASDAPSGPEGPEGNLEDVSEAAAAAEAAGKDAPADAKGKADAAKAPPKKDADKKPKGEERQRRMELRRGRAGFNFPKAADLKIELPPSEKYGDAEFELRRIDDDGKLDIVVLRVSASLWQLARVMTTKKITLDVSFEAMLQRPDGSFAPSAGKPFETKVRIDLRRGIDSLPSGPNGDFDGDRRTDLLEFTEGSRAEIHLTTPAGVFPADPAWVVPLPRAPEDRSLLDVEDLNGDGRSDAAFFNPDGDGFIVTLMRSRP